MSNGTATADLTIMTPAEIDTILSEIWGRINAVQTQIADINDKARSARKAVKQGFKHYDGLAEKYEARIPALREQLVPIKAEALPYENEYVRRGGWSRAFLVSNSNGHVHSSMNCSTCFITTQYAWMIDYSGKDEAEIVEAAGCMACTVCFPSAPVEILAQPTKMFVSPEAKAKAEKKAAAEASKCKGSLTHNYDRATARLGYCAGNYGICNDCGQRVTVTKSNALRSHAAK
jgi:hypothetical protein